MWHERFVVASLVVRWLADHRTRAETVECSPRVASKGPEHDNQSDSVPLSEIVTARRLQHSSLNVISVDGALESRLSFETPRGPLLFSERQLETKERGAATRDRAAETEEGRQSTPCALVSPALTTGQLPQHGSTASTKPRPGTNGALDGVSTDMTVVTAAAAATAVAATFRTSAPMATQGDCKSSTSASSASGMRDSASSGSSGDDTEGGGTNAATIKSQPAWEVVTSTSTKLIMFERSWGSTLKFARRLRKMGNAYVPSALAVPGRVRRIGWLPR